MRCFKSGKCSCALQRIASGVATWTLLLALMPALVGVRVGHAQSGPEITQMQLERSEDGLFLSASVRFELPPIVEDALKKGIPMFFVAQATLMRDRWYWTDKEVVVQERYLRLAYLPLTRRWRVNSAAEPIGNAGLGVSLTQHYELLDEALAAIQRIGRWKIADASQLERDARYWVDLSFRLDLSQLPRPFQIGAVGQGEWNLSASRSQRWLPEVSK